jgi:hypothetical protein
MLHATDRPHFDDQGIRDVVHSSTARRQSRLTQLSARSTSALSQVCAVNASRSATGPASRRRARTKSPRGQASWSIRCLLRTAVSECFYEIDDRGLVECVEHLQACPRCEGDSPVLVRIRGQYYFGPVTPRNTVELVLEVRAAFRAPILDQDATVFQPVNLHVRRNRLRAAAP